MDANGQQGSTEEEYAQQLADARQRDKWTIERQKSARIERWLDGVIAATFVAMFVTLTVRMWWTGPHVVQGAASTVLQKAFVLRRRAPS